MNSLKKCFNFVVSKPSNVGVITSRFLKNQLFALSFCLAAPLLLSAKSQEEISVQQRYALVQQSMQKKEYLQVLDNAKAIIHEAPASPFAAETTFYLGVSYFNLRDFDLSNYYFSQFLEKYAAPQFFEQCIEYKYLIAEEFETGSGRHMFGIERLPKWVNAWEDALELYDEVIKTLPTHEVAAKALFRKAGMLKSERKYKEAVDVYASITRRFPKHIMSPESYLAISQVYFDQSKSEYPDRDYLHQARLNVKRFKRDFPSEERLLIAESLLVEMQDSYAKDLWVSAQYFEKKRKYDAARLYYEKIARMYPESTYAKEAVARIAAAEVNMTTVQELNDIIEENSADASTNSDEKLEA